ncbi:MAG: dethiobiotin synthase [Balneola sp.]|nr:dethiobiotin synthase [Balneola sp.]MBO6650178.1 dethiobiotin synthase [Balneola sp.]MBO6710542.1 dethiobiotin synthase [Balneola sp.]MBO6799227.1 dethiobiotin synthase [Balneola sp.]MBO6871066.1 dethiobiotin synthase [Balneola sp.]
MEFPKEFFITGTDTGIGKTLVSGMLMSALDATYWKPIQAGLDEETDTEFVQRVSKADPSRIIPERYRLETPMSPHAAADIDGVKISLNDFELPEYDTKHLIVEGAGGLIVPINWEHTVLDVIERLKLPVLLVARSSLGTLNHTLLSLEALRDRGIEVFAVVLNGEKHPSNKETIERFGDIDVFEVETLQNVDSESLKKAFNQNFQLRIKN